MERPEDAAPAILDRAARATRGKRMTKLLDEDAEQDDIFWNQDALKEDEVDDNYEEEGEAVDEYDSDFDEDVPEGDVEPENEVRERLPIKKRLILPGKMTKKKKSKKKVLSKIEHTSGADKTPDPSSPFKVPEDAPAELEAEKTIRKSTRTSVIVRQVEREEIQALLQATKKPIKRKKEGEERRMTQEEMLLEAAETEIMNLRNLQRVLAREEEVKKKAIIHKADYEGPQIRYCSKDGVTHLEFLNGATFDSELCTTSVPYPEKSFCAVTGLPAKYRDPKSGLPYATLEAFKVIRERYLQQESEKNKMKFSAMGALYDSLSSEGFSQHRKRSGGERKRPMDSRPNARFRRIPALDLTDDE